MMSTATSCRKNHQAVSLEGVDPETCMIVFKTHWTQVVKILEKHDPLKNVQAKYGVIPPDEASTVQNYVEHMLFLLIEEQAKDAAMGPILEFVVTENIMEKLFLWSLRREFTDEMKIEQLKMYEMLVTQSHQPLLHHKPILKPLMMLLSSCSGTTTPAVEVELVVLLNQLCSILAKDPSILELFFHTSEDQGAANFLIFSLLIPFIHREGTVGQQARDALLFIMSLSAENSVVANYIVENTYFCPVLATGLSGLYSSLPTKLEDKGEEWHCLLKDDWLLSPALVQFMNSLEFCNAVIQVAHPLIRNQLVSYIYNGFLVPVMAPALHKVTVEEVMTTTAYLDLFLRSVSEPALLKIFLRFILLHRHENVHILDTLTSRINTPFRLCVVSLALFKTLISLHCEDVMLQLVLRYLIPCNHIMFSQRWAVRERDWYSVSAARLLALTPVCCCSGITLTFERQEKDYILWRKNMHGAGSPEEYITGGVIDSKCIVEYGKTVDISYLQYLWDAQTLILHCMKDCEIWSAPYDGENPDPYTFIQTLAEEDEADHNGNVKLLSPENEDFISQCDNIIKELDSNTTGLVELKLLIPDAISPVEEEEDFENFSADTPSTESMPSPFGPKETWLSNPARIQNIPFTGPFISVVLSKLENMLENSLHVNLLLIGIITHLASYPQPLLRSFLLNTNMVFQPSVRSLYQVLASVKNKIEQFASIEKDFPGLLIQAQQYLLLRVDMSDISPESLTKDNMQHNNITGKGRNLSEASQLILQPFLGSKAKKGTALPSVPLHIRNAILAAALFPEFLKELAALAQEHSILCYKVFSDLEDYY
ncbi:FHF complex subunit HOOK interacting protein 1A isoform X2 [Sceloporus undulatus]|uniref:FHF complex subunit HOOK interacting protein 1A isoform X2 n=1 Tax=Sceloporus undulatus TaxID=8520 RepID=UPI001C4B1889|nr:FHF complex subunit HOOK interacting protein 1A isoform X2 [Sceloporus undulatus]